jgi:hypothetical protein
VIPAPRKPPSRGPQPGHVSHAEPLLLTGDVHRGAPSVPSCRRAPVHSHVRYLGSRSTSRRSCTPSWPSRASLVARRRRDEFSKVADLIGFRPSVCERPRSHLTRSSRPSLEFGYRTEDAALLGGATAFLVKLMHSSWRSPRSADTLLLRVCGTDFSPPLNSSNTSSSTVCKHSVNRAL